MSGRRLRLASSLAVVLAGLLAAGSALADHVFRSVSVHPGGVNATGRIIFSGDADGDGVGDVVWQHGTALAVLIGQGDGTFFPPFDVPTGLASLSPDAAVADIDGDGLLDSAHVAADGSAYVVLWGPGGGAPAATGGPLPAGTGTVPFFADADGDGDLDLWIGGRGVALLINVGGSFSAVVSSRAGSGAVSRTALAVGDVSGDGRADLVTAPLDGRGNGVDVLLAGTDPSSGMPGIESVVPVSTGFQAPSLVEAADVDGDGRADLVLNGRQTSNGLAATRVLVSNGGGAFTARPAALSRDRSSGAGTDVRVADFDRDGDLDVVVGCDDSPDCRSLLLHRGTGSGGLTTAEPIGVLQPCSRLEVADLNCDGAPDLLGGAQAITTLVNAGDATFEDEIAVVFSGTDFAVCNFDADGQPDVAGIAAAGVETALGTLCAVPEAACTSPTPTAVASGSAVQCGVALQPVLVPVSGGFSIPAAAPIGRYCWTSDLGVFAESGLPFFCSPRANATLVVPAGPGGQVAHLVLEVTDFNGCRDTDDLTVQTDTPPVITLAQANPSQTCPGEPIEFVARATDTFFPFNLVTLHWDFDIAVNSDGRAGADDDVDAEVVAVSGNTAVTTVSDLAPGSHVARLTAISESSSLCVGTVDVPYRVVPLPTLGTIRVEQSGCADEPFVFRTSASGGDAPVVIGWDFDIATDTDGNGDPTDDIEALGPTVEWTFPTGGTYTVRAAAIDANACRRTRDVTVIALDVPDASFTSTSPVCDTVVVSFQDTSTGVAPLLVTWDFGDGSAPVVGRTPTHVYPRPGTYSVTQQVLDGRGCTTTNVERVFVGTGEVAVAGLVVQDGESGTGTTGNTNGFAEPGESIGLLFDVENRGAQTVTDVQVSVAVVSPAAGVSVLRSTAVAPALNPGDRRTTQAPQVMLELASGYPCGTPLVIDVSVSAFSSGGCGSTRRISLPTGLPTLAPVGSAMRATQTAGTSETPDTAFGASQHLTVFSDTTDGRPQVRLLRQTTTGAIVEASQVLSPSDADQLSPRIAWSSANAQGAVAWLERNGSGSVVAFARLTPSGDALSGALRFSVHSQAGAPDIAWTGRAWVVAWPETASGRTAVHARFVDTDGIPVGPLLLASSANDVGVADMGPVRVAATGGRWIAVFPRTSGGSTTLRVRAFDSDVLNELAPVWIRDLGPTRTASPAADALVDTFVIAHETTDGNVEAIALDVDGSTNGRTTLGAGAAPAVSGGPGFAAVVRQSGGEVLARGVDRLGGSFGSDVNVSAEAGDSRTPAVSCDADGLILAAWSDERTVTGGVSEIFTRVLQPVGGGGCSSTTLGDLAPLPGGDGVVTVGDVVVALRIAVGLEPATPELLAKGDVAPGVRTGNVHRVIGDGRIDIGDVVVLLAVAAGQITLTR